MRTCVRLCGSGVFLGVYDGTPQQRICELVEQFRLRQWIEGSRVDGTGGPVLRLFVGGTIAGRDVCSAQY